MPITRNSKITLGLVFAAINAENEQAGELLRWGGKFRRLGDACHFEMIVPKKEKA